MRPNYNQGQQNRPFHRDPPRFLNPFHFVPIPLQGPLELSHDIIHSKNLVEGFIEYSLETLTPLHITGRISAQEVRIGPKILPIIKEKFFYKRNNTYVIPGSSIRGMLSSFLEALTGSDMACFTRGDEKGERGKGAPYEKKDGRKSPHGRHVAFLMAAKKSGTSNPKNDHGRKPIHTLPFGYGQRQTEDAARFLFGYVNEEAEALQADKENKETINEEKIARGGRLIFEDLQIDNAIKTVAKEAFDIAGDSVFGSPNPRANTAWYFSPGAYRVRRVEVRSSIFHTWEVLADQIRGRKFYFHQDPTPCYNYYKKHWTSWTQLSQYEVESIPEKVKVENGRIYFNKLPEELLALLLYAVQLPDHNMAHKLGALKPFGFGSIKMTVTKIQARSLRDGVINIAPLEEYSVSKPVDINHFCYKPAKEMLSRILHYPQKNKDNIEDYIFIYPTCSMKREEPWKKAFSTPEESSLTQGYFPGSTPPKEYPRPGNRKKITMFFDEYQRSTRNYKTIFEGRNG